jgi:hypothetical protein
MSAWSTPSGRAAELDLQQPLLGQLVEAEWRCGMAHVEPRF